MIRRLRFSEVMKFGSNGVAIECDGCGVVFDLVADGGIYADMIKDGSLYDTPRSNLCWRCVKKGEDEKSRV